MSKEAEKKPELPKSAQYAQMELIIENYKKSNPKKYEIKKDELAKKLAALK